MGPLLHSCAEVRAAIELSFGVVSGVGPGIHELDGVHVSQKEGAVWGFFGICAPIGLNGLNKVFSHRNVFDFYIKS